MVALWNSADHYIFALWFLSSVFFLSSFNLSGRRLDVYHTSTHSGPSANLECRSEMCCKRLAGNTGRTNDAKIAIWAPSRNFVGLYRQSEKKLVNQQYLLQMSLQYRELRPLMAEIDWRVWGTPSYFNGYRVLATLLHGSQVVGVSQTLRRWTEGATYVR